MNDCVIYYTAIEENDNLTVIEELPSLIEATCSFYQLRNLAINSIDEIEHGKYVDEDMEVILAANPNDDDSAEVNSL